MLDLFDFGRARAPAALLAGLLLTACADTADTDRVRLVEGDGLGVPTAPGTLPRDVTEGNPVGADADPANLFTNASFEQGSASWAYQGDSVTLTSSNIARSGKASLLVSGRNAVWNGLRRDLPDSVEPATNYQFSAWVRLPAGELSTEVRIQVKRTVDGTEHYQFVAGANVTSTAWVRVAGDYSFPAGGEITEHFMFIEAERASASYLVEDVILKPAAPGSSSSSSGSGGSSSSSSGAPTGARDFARNGSVEQSLDTWYPQGDDAVLERTTEQALDGQYSVYISGRSDTWHAPVMNFEALTAGSQYVFSAGVRLPAGASAGQAQLTLKIVDAEGEPDFINLASGTATADQWLILRGTYQVPTGVVAEAAYVELGSTSATYYVDHFRVSQLSGIRNLVGSGDAEVDIEGWGVQGNAALTRLEDAAYQGSYGVAVSGRTAAWHGPTITPSALVPGMVYNLSVWMRLAPGAAPTDGKLTIKLADEASGDDPYIQVVQKSVAANGWTELSGAYLHAPVGEISEFFAYVETTSGTDAFYLDDFQVVEEGSTGEPIAYPNPDPQAQGGIAVGHAKFLGNVINYRLPASFGRYWNQVTPENAAKWGEVEKTRDQMNWADLDRAYAYARANQMPFKLHTLVWGSQSPAWLAALPAAEQAQEVEEWLAELASRYADIDAIDVVNEPLNAPPSYRNALGGNGSTGFDWVIWSFEKARAYFPNARLLLNEYGTENDESARNRYIQLANLLHSRGLLDGIGIQAHYFNVDTMSGAQITSALDQLAGVGVPVYVSELDISGADEAQQLARYQAIFPAMWQHPAVAGVTLWGYEWGQTWRHPDSDPNTEDALTALLNQDGSERAALRWLREYLGAEASN